MKHIPPPKIALRLRPGASQLRFGPPVGVDQDDCGIATVLQGYDEMGEHTVPVHYAYFELEPDDLLALSEGAPIELALWGSGIQPFSVNVLKV